jgi:hypothetical protein
MTTLSNVEHDACGRHIRGSNTANNNSVGLLKKSQEFGSFNLFKGIYRNYFRKT